MNELIKLVLSTGVPGILLVAIAFYYWKFNTLEKAMDAKASCEQLAAAKREFDTALGQNRKDINAIGGKLSDHIPKAQIAISAIAIKAGVPEVIPDLLKKEQK